MNFFDEIVFSRRTNKNFDGRPVTRELLEQMLAWAIRAPNHRLNQPWRFRVFDQRALQKLCDHLDQEWSVEDKLTHRGAMEKFLKIGAMIYVSALKDPNEIIQQENYAAACAAVQNILLGAASLGLESFWSTGKLMKSEPMLRYLDWKEQDEQWVGAIWLGYGSKPELKTRKGLEEVTRWWS